MLFDLWGIIQGGQNPPGIISTPKIGGGGYVKTLFFLDPGAGKKYARLLAPYALIAGIGRKVTWSRKKSDFFLAREAIRSVFWGYPPPKKGPKRRFLHYGTRCTGFQKVRKMPNLGGPVFLMFFDFFTKKNKNQMWFLRESGKRGDKLGKKCHF